MRICSLLPSSTEIIYALGLEDQLVAVSHECDYPPVARQKPQVTASTISSTLTSSEIDFMVRRQLSDVGTLYELNERLLESMEPDIILTQELCTVCAVSFQNVTRLVSKFRKQPHVINLEPTSLEGIFQTILDVGKLAGVPVRARTVVEDLRKRIERLSKFTSAVEKRKVLFLEWIDPPFCAGHWIPELIEIAGGYDTLSRRSAPSTQLALNEIIEYTPEVVVVSCCGFSVERTLDEIDKFMKNCRPAVEEADVVVVDGSAYFSRPGPRIVESAEILATILHPELFPYDYPEHVVRRVTANETTFT